MGGVNCGHDPIKEAEPRSSTTDSLMMVFHFLCQYIIEGNVRVS